MTTLILAATSRATRPITAIRGVSFDVSEGQIVTILGANGAGKTTVLKSVRGAGSRRRARSPSGAAASSAASPIGWRGRASPTCRRGARSSPS